MLPPNFVLSGLNDSKKLTAKVRERLYAEITTNSDIRWTSIAISPQEIDSLNILGATHSGMRAGDGASWARERRRRSTR
jgi:ribonuclease HII